MVPIVFPIVFFIVFPTTLKYWGNVVQKIVVGREIGNYRPLECIPKNTTKMVGKTGERKAVKKAQPQ
jgi:hypothetical protein